MTSLVWLRRDLRLHDHPALRAALDAGGPVVPVFCFDDRILRGRHASGPRTQFLLDSLADLGHSLRRRGGGLVLRRGRPERILPRLVAELGADHVFWSQDVGPFARRRDEAVGSALESAGAQVAVLPGLFAVDEPSALRTAAGAPYTVFTPFHRAWLLCRRRDVLPAPRRLPPLPSGLRPGSLPGLQDLGLEEMVDEPAPGGEQAARGAMQRFLSAGSTGYESAHDDMGREGTSRLSPYLHFGCISPRELEERLGREGGAEAFRRQLCWREFYAHVLAHFPENSHHEFQARYRGTIRWSQARRRFEAWCTGRTGYPLVDAAMRQLRREGWMHNRGRLVVASFLTKDLGIDWRWGESWFMRLLIDGDEANNNGNWQWIASVGVDPQPPYRRIYNPARQQQRFDPTGAYVRRYVPELWQVPDDYLAEPWTMPRTMQTAVRCVIGRDYPAPIVAHATARRQALARYGEAAAGAEADERTSRQRADVGYARRGGAGRGARDHDPERRTSAVRNGIDATFGARDRERRMDDS
jgi:deoxyribodipyrimidine photo-lyase